ncbi:RNA 2',3'-cyclic phosphodiesterase [Methylolobus aquaticus]|nr:RNA 2',3'-cyclic phosphodiesterase [Methylolobus aquaticus]
MPCEADAARARHRVFYALWPSDGVRAALEASVRELAQHAQARWVRAENFHITLRFLGSVSPAQLEYLCHQREPDAASFTLQLNQLRYRRRRQLLWMEPSVVPSAWGELEASLRAALDRGSANPEALAPIPHVTLGRKVCLTVPFPPATPTIIWPVESVVLVESTLRPSGSEYCVLRRWRLQSTPAGGSMK